MDAFRDPKPYREELQPHPPFPFPLELLPLPLLLLLAESEGEFVVAVPDEPREFPVSEEGGG